MQSAAASSRSGSYALLRGSVILAAGLLLWPFGQAILTTWLGAARHATASIRGHPSRVRLGMALVVISVLVHVYSLLLDVWALAGLAAVGLLAGLVLVAHGTAGLRAALPALLMALFVVPPPTAIVDFAQAQLTVLVARSAHLALPVLLGQGVELVGTELLFGDQRVSIVDDCSGLGGILIAPPFVMLLLFLAHVPFGLRWVLVLAVSPLLAAAANLLRVLVGSVLVARGHAAQVADGLIHELLGIGPLLLAGLASWWLVHAVAPAPRASEAAR
jgi:exosortase/archaeosortase family protein